MAAITGIGMVSPVGVTTAECWRNFCRGVSGIRTIDRFDTGGCRTKIAGVVPGSYFDLEKSVLSKSEREQAVFAGRLALVVAAEAIADAHFPTDHQITAETAVISGCSGSVYSDEVLFGDRHGGASPQQQTETLDAYAHLVASRWGFKGPNFNVATACSSSAYALALGCDYVRRAQRPCLVIGTDAMLSAHCISGFNQILALSEQNSHPDQASRPFDKRRDGFVLSEGACGIMLEPPAQAAARGIRIYAMISGYALTSEAYNILAPEPSGRQMARTCLRP